MPAKRIGIEKPPHYWCGFSFRYIVSEIKANKFTSHLTIIAYLFYSARFYQLIHTFSIASRIGCSNIIGSK